MKKLVVEILVCMVLYELISIACWFINDIQCVDSVFKVSDAIMKFIIAYNMTNYFVDDIAR